MAVMTQDAVGVTRLPGSKLYWAINDGRVLAGRYVTHILRQPDEIIMSVMIPTVMLLLFRYMLGGAVDVGSTTYANFLVPGVLTIGVTLTAVSTTSGVFLDMQEGFVDRFRSMSVSSIAVIVGHVTAAVLRSMIAIAALIGIGFAVGFRPSADLLHWVGAILMLLLFAIAVGWISAFLGQIANSTAGASGLAMIISFLPYSSNLFAPTEAISPGLRAFVEHQPVTHVIDTLRALFLNQPVGDSLWLALLWWGGLTLLIIPLSARRFRRRFA